MKIWGWGHICIQLCFFFVPPPISRDTYYMQVAMISLALPCYIEYNRGRTIKVLTYHDLSAIVVDRLN